MVRSISLSLSLPPTLPGICRRYIFQERYRIPRVNARRGGAASTLETDWYRIPEIAQAPLPRAPKDPAEEEEARRRLAGTRGPRPARPQPLYRPIRILSRRRVHLVAVPAVISRKKVRREFPLRCTVSKLPLHLRHVREPRRIPGRISYTHRLAHSPLLYFKLE